MNVTKVLNRLKKAYKVKNMAELSNCLGVSISTFNTWRNRKIVPEKYILKCSQMTGYDYEWFIKENFSQLIEGDNNIQISGENNILRTDYDSKYNQLFNLIKNYATPKLIKEFTNKLLKIKEIHES